MADVDRLTREYKSARQMYLSAKAQRQAAMVPWNAPSKEVVAALRLAYRNAAVELADAVAGPA